MKRPTRVPSQLSSSLHKRLNAYAVAASAAGVGVLALAQPADAKIVYTPAHIKVGDYVGHNVPLDLNHDGQVDFSLRDFSMCTTGCQNVFVGLWVTRAATSNKVWATFPNYFGASALPAGVVVGSKGKFLSDREWMAGFHYNIYTNGSHVYSVGPWRGVKDRYLGLQFRAKDGLHYGWARLNVRCKKSKALGTRKGLRTLGVLTGYAYETIPNKPIIAGKTHGGDEATLGRLALGASGVVSRQK
jgi:hypothetical protein